MTAAIFGLVGTAVGAVAALIGSVLSARWQARHEDLRWRRDEARWHRDQMVAAYDEALRCLNRAANHGLVQPRDKEAWLEELVEAQFWLQSLMGRSSAAHSALQEIADELQQEIVGTLNAEMSGPHHEDLDSALFTAVLRVSDSFRTYMSRQELGPIE
jgi:hypothetical protein